MSEMTLAEIRDEVAETNEAFMARYRNGDAAGVADFYTKGGQIFPPNSDIVTGRPAIQAFYQAMIDMGIKEIVLETAELEGSYNAAFEVATYTLLDEKGQTLDQGKCIIIWKQEDGAWKQHRDMYNSSMITA